MATRRAVECRKGGINDLEENEVDPVDTNEAWLAPIERYVGQDHDPTWMPEMALRLLEDDELMKQIEKEDEELMKQVEKEDEELKKQVEKKDESHEEPRVQVACRWSPPPWEVAGDIYAMTIQEAIVDEMTSCEVALLELARSDARGTTGRDGKRS